MKAHLSALAAGSLLPLLFCGVPACGGSAGAGGSSGSDVDAAANGSDTGAALSDGGDAKAPSGDGRAPSADGGDAGKTSGKDSGAAGGDAGPQSLRKRGEAYGSNSVADMTALSKGIGWWYNWSPSPDSTLNGAAVSNVEFVPMIWGGTFSSTTLATQVPADAKYLLTFNEPNFGSQSNLTPQQAAALWPQVEAFADPRGLKIVSPALNYCGGSCNETNPFTWLDAFFAACTGCRVDYIAAHWYSCSKSALQGYLNDYETKYTQPIWVTEFSCLDGSLAATDANESAYMTDAITVLEQDPRIFRYSWFTGRWPASPAISLLGGDGALTALGQQYVAAPQ